MNPYELDTKQLLSKFHTNKNGLSSKKAKRRLEEFGLNTIENEDKKNYIKEYLKQYIQFFAILLEVAALLSFIADHYVPDQGSDILGTAILAAVVINATFAFWQDYKADQAMEALLRLIPTLVNVKRDDEKVTLDASKLVPGDILIIEEGDKIAADAVIIENSSLYINTSALNGESKPSRRESENKKVKLPLEAKNMIFAGTTAVSGSAIAVVTATAHATQFGKIATLTKNVKKTITPIQKEIIRITQILTLIAVMMGIVFFILGIFSDRNILIASIFALSLIVANVPEGLMPTITLALSMASQRMAKRNALIKNLDSVQTLGSATVICTDKTGTLTKNEMTLKEIYLSSGEKITIEGVGYETKGVFRYENSNDRSKIRLENLLYAGLLNSRATIENGNFFGDPTELSIVAAAKKMGLDPKNYKKISENPFTGERKMMSSLYTTDKNEQILYIKGAPEVILQRSSSYIDKNSSIQTLDQKEKEKIKEQLDIFENNAYRVLAIGINSNNSEDDIVFLGLVAIMDLPRAEVKEALVQCAEAGIRTMMLTGDNHKTAAAVAKKIGLKYDKIVTGEEIAKFTDTELEEILKDNDILFARMESNQKLKIATALQKNGEVVAMTGDGVNDAPSLKRADIGIAMGQSGTEVAKEAADMILLDDNFRSIVAAIEEGRTVYFNIKKFVTYILSSNVPEIVPYILQFFFKIPLPLSVIQILSIDLGSDMLPGLALGSEKPEANIMKRPPVGKNEKILDWEVFKRGYFFIGLIEAAAAMAAFISFLLLHGWEYGVVDLNDPLLHRQAMTMTLLGAVTCQLFNAWTMRSWEYSAFSIGWNTNKLLLIAMGIEILWIWMLLNVESVQMIFNTAYVPMGDLWILLPFPIILFVSHELYKYRIRKKKNL
ncbi:MAG: cation-transporting P-type ATPase [Campylobacterota bacterium]|nr:cation-transporting P-type ATPase [Campylobacterota bacterium]